MCVVKNQTQYGFYKYELLTAFLKSAGWNFSDKFKETINSFSSIFLTIKFKHRLNEVHFWFIKHQETLEINQEYKWNETMQSVYKKNLKIVHLEEFKQLLKCKRKMMLRKLIYLITSKYWINVEWSEKI